MLACLPVLGAACNDPQSTAAAEPAGGDKTEKAEKAEKVTVARKDAKAAKRSGPRINAPVEPEAPVDPQERRLMPIPGDPPFIDGYNPEEEPCPSGNWCGSIESAMAIAPNPEAVPKEMDCPVRIGGVTGTKIEGPKYAGLSSKPSMQGALNQHGTELARAAGKDNQCCYHWFEYCSGRPLVDDRAGGRVVVADAIDGAGWAGSLSRGTTPDPAIRDALVEAWRADAAAEHASVASFARVVLELLAVGAPADLVSAAIAAGQDEVAHAQSCYAIAARLSGRSKQPGPLPIVAPREATLLRVAVDTFLEGCVGETIAALCAERAAARASDPAIREVLERIADDESRHAALAWRTLHWALAQGGREVAHAVKAAAAEVLSVDPQLPAAVDHPDWSRFGRLSAREHADAVRDARREIVAPMLASLLA